VRVSAQVYLRTADGKSLARESPGSDQLVIRGPSEGDEEVFGVVRLGGSQVALRASNGQYLSAPQGDGAEVHATAPEVGAWECLEIEEVGDQQVVFRTANGRYLTRGRNGGDRLLANGTTKWDAEAFQTPGRFGV
jgi:hypothetical protein